MVNIWLTIYTATKSFRIINENNYLINEVQLYTSTGVLAKSVIVNGLTPDIPISHLEEGMYIVKFIFNDVKSIAKKLYIQK